jgi:hypothetical protein
MRASEPVDRSAVERDFPVERGFEFACRNRNVFAYAQHVGEGQAHEADVALLGRAKDVALAKRSLSL